MLAAVVDREGVPDEVRDDGRPTRPGLDDLLRVLLVLHVDLLEQMVVDERTLLETAWHRLISWLTVYRWCFLPVRRRRTMSLSLGLCALRVRPSGLPHGLTG